MTKTTKTVSNAVKVLDIRSKDFVLQRMSPEWPINTHIDYVGRVTTFDEAIFRLEWRHGARNYEALRDAYLGVLRTLFADEDDRVEFAAMVEESDMAFAIRRGLPGVHATTLTPPPMWMLVAINRFYKECIEDASA